ncbi:MAG: amidohydrolase family protein [Saprospiraceae bacterium]|nr:amidohydrolase family protein [Saprospiraceae bacterium]MBK6564713.1 amidohydrolase family protein [Saprospiraceae bacterium]MBK6784759.1 amidohydrolase family protein [Saprospiraceae bacterium]MBK7523355.1 amidohydrolase family protein [Saprospiraceae bacterium]MBK8079455.1 amidohydrolase family protein [Saprospiraceae bacterium]
MADTYPKINAHGHVLPYQNEIPSFMKKKEIFWLTQDNKFMCQKNWKRPVTHPSFFLKEKVEWMEKNNIDHEVVITLSQLYANGYEKELACDIIRFQNDFQQSVQEKYPEKFTVGFVVQPAYTEDAIKEMERCVYQLGLKVLCLPTHFYDTDRSWKSIADEKTKPIFALANELKLAIEIHPYDSEKMVALEDVFWRFHLIWMCAQTADAFHLYSNLNFSQLYPETRVCFAHGNQFGQMGHGRRVQAYLGRPDLFENGKDPRENIRCSNVFFDTLVHDVWSFELLVKRQGTSQIVAGLDDPYPLGEMDGIPDSYPGKVLDDAVYEGVITKAEQKNIWNRNVINWLGFEPGLNNIRK